MTGSSRGPAPGVTAGDVNQGGEEGRAQPSQAVRCPLEGATRHRQVGEQQVCILTRSSLFTTFCVVRTGNNAASQAGSVTFQSPGLLGAYRHVMASPSCRRLRWWGRAPAIGSTAASTHSCGQSQSAMDTPRTSGQKQYTASGSWRCEASPTGAHHWLIGEQGQKLSAGACKYCDEQRDHANSQEYSAWHYIRGLSRVGNGARRGLKRSTE